MANISERIVDFLRQTDGRTDREITDALLGHAANQQPVNAACRKLAERGALVRRKSHDGLIGNFLVRRHEGSRDARATSKSSTALAQINSVKAAGDSIEQRLAESALLEELGKKLGVTLTKKTLRLPDGGRLELDGASDAPPIICEAWAHIGPAKVAQKHKLMTDAFKLSFASLFLPSGTRKILVMADPEAARHLRGRGWMAQALKANNIELHFVELRAETIDAVRAAQKRQFR